MELMASYKVLHETMSPKGDKWVRLYKTGLSEYAILVEDMVALNETFRSEDKALETFNTMYEFLTRRGHVSDIKYESI